MDPNTLIPPSNPTPVVLPVPPPPKTHTLLWIILCLILFAAGFGVAKLLPTKQVPITNQVPTNTPSPSPTPIPSTKTYTSKKHFVSFDFVDGPKYVGISVSENENEIDIGQGLDAFLLAIYSQDSSLDLKTWWQQWKFSKDHAKLTNAYTASQFLGKDAFNVSFQANTQLGDKRAILVKNGSRNYAIITSQTPMADQILSTLHFLNQNAQTYTYRSKPTPNSTLPAFEITYPLTWTLEKGNNDPFFTWTISKDGYSLNISQAAGSGTICSFADSPTYSGVLNPIDLKNTKYVEISGTSIFRRWENTELPPKTFSFCSKDSNSLYFVSLSPVGNIWYTTPVSSNETMLKEMDKIVETITTVRY